MTNMIETFEKVADYLLESEQRHWEECGKPKEHIYNDAVALKDWLNSPMCPLVEPEELEETERDYEVTISVKQYVNVKVKATDQADAQEKALKAYDAGEGEPNMAILEPQPGDIEVEEVELI
jgi:hypothetical protein